jgi:hypothetical protein
MNRPSEKHVRCSEKLHSCETKEVIWKYSGKEILATTAYNVIVIPRATWTAVRITPCVSLIVLRWKKHWFDCI